MSTVITQEARESAMAVVKYAKMTIEKAPPELLGDETWQGVAMSLAQTFKMAGVKLVFNDGTDIGPAVTERIMTDTPRDELASIIMKILAPRPGAR